MYYGMKFVAVICALCVVLWVADEDVSFVMKMGMSSRGGMRCVGTCCRRVRMRQGRLMFIGRR
jgi:hypothetical protein